MSPFRRCRGYPNGGLTKVLRSSVSAGTPDSFSPNRRTVQVGPVTSFLVGLEPVAHAGLGQQVSRTRRIGFQLLPKLRHVLAKQMA